MHWLKRHVGSNRWLASLLVSGLLATSLFALEPQKHRGKHWWTPAIPPAPPGSYVRQFMQVQSDKAEPSDFVVFLDEWYKGGDKLGPYGQYHLTEMAQRLGSVPFPVVIEPHFDPNLNEIRRQLVITGLKNLGIQDAEVRVVLAHPQAEGLRGIDIDQAYGTMVSQQGLLSRFGFFNNFAGVGRGGLFGGAGFFGGGFSGSGSRPLLSGY